MNFLASLHYVKNIEVVEVLRVIILHGTSKIIYDNVIYNSSGTYLITIRVSDLSGNYTDKSILVTFAAASYLINVTDFIDFN